MSKEQLRQDFLRKKNTFHYSVCSADGINSSNPNSFDFYIISQNVTNPINLGERVSGSADFDLSCFYVRVDGLGIQPSLGSTIQNSAIRYGTNTFFVPNQNAGADLKQSFEYQRMSGGQPADYDVVCSNPVGSAVNIQVFDGEGAGELIPNGNGTYDAIINFSIELLDLD